jgi:hypothetical protein
MALEWVTLEWVSRERVSRERMSREGMALEWVTPGSVKAGEPPLRSGIRREKGRRR